MTVTIKTAYSASLVSQGKYRFYTLSMPSEVLATTCTVDTRADNPTDGFQRRLDERRADEIARYIDEGLGTIPTAIVLSAQPEAELEYIRPKKTIAFRQTPRAFLILDGQHRVYGFAKAKTSLRVPVVIYNGLNRQEESKLFIDINTKQRPVPNELLLDIKKLAETETGDEALRREVFDFFAKEPSSPLAGLMSPSARTTGKISRVTFNAALNMATTSFGDEVEPKRLYEVLAAYVNAWLSGLRRADAADRITNPTMFKAIMMLFPAVAQRVNDRHGSDYSVANFHEVLEPLFMRARKSTLRSPGASHRDLHESFAKALRQFTLSV
jgi:DGQHR domain-containing protein